MSNELLTPERTKSSTARTLVQAAALAAALVPLGSVAVETASITCGFGTVFGDVPGSGGCTSESPSSNTFSFEGYFFQLDFELTPGGPDFTVTVNTTTDLALNHGEGEMFPGYECIALSADDGCVDFQVDTHGATSSTHWLHYFVTIDWEDWDDLLYSGIEPRMRMLHDRTAPDGADAPGTYDFDMCITPGLYDACEAWIDPGLKSGDTDFDSNMVTLSPATPVPEPSSMILLATGAAALYRKRRRSNV